MFNQNNKYIVKYTTIKENMENMNKAYDDKIRNENILIEKLNSGWEQIKEILSEFVYAFNYVLEEFQTDIVPEIRMSLPSHDVNNTYQLVINKQIVKIICSTLGKEIYTINLTYINDNNHHFINSLYDTYKLALKSNINIIDIVNDSLVNKKELCEAFYKTFEKVLDEINNYYLTCTQEIVISNNSLQSEIDKFPKN